MKVVAFLQNQWFKNPDRMKWILEKQYKGDRELFVSTFLFFRCQTGQRLRKSLGEEWCERIIWENASPEIAGEASGCFPPDIEHMAAVIRKHQPRVIIAYGKQAKDGLELMKPLDVFRDRVVIYSPHPAARHAAVYAELAKIRGALDHIEAFAKAA